MKVLFIIIFTAVFLYACGTGYQRRGEYPSYYGGAGWECYRIESSGWGTGNIPGCEMYPRYQR